jgi:hypothetical protein
VSLTEKRSRLGSLSHSYPLPCEWHLATTFAAWKPAPTDLLPSCESGILPRPSRLGSPLPQTCRHPVRVASCHDLRGLEAPPTENRIAAWKPAPTRNPSSLLWEGGLPGVDLTGSLPPPRNQPARRLGPHRAGPRQNRRYNSPPAGPC